MRAVPHLVAPAQPRRIRRNTILLRKLLLLTEIRANGQAFFVHTVILLNFGELFLRHRRRGCESPNFFQTVRRLSPCVVVICWYGLPLSFFSIPSFEKRVCPPLGAG